MADEEDDPDDEADVGGEEIDSLPVNEDGEAVGQHNEDAEETAIPREVGLERRDVRQRASAGEAAVGKRALESRMAEYRGGPVDKTRNRRDIEQPVKHLATAGRQIEEGQEAPLAESRTGRAIKLPKRYIQ